MKRVEFEVTYPAELTHPLHRRLAREDGVSRMELLTWSPTGSVTTLSWYDAEPATVESVLAAVGPVSTRSLIEGDGGTYAFVHQTAYGFDDDLMGVVADARAVFLPPVTFFAGGDAAFEAVGTPATLSRLRARLDDLIDVRIDRVREFRRGSAPAALTDRQRAALDAAAAVGYYEVPRTGSVERVAAELDCAPSTAGELLRRAESALVAERVDGDTPG